MTPSELQHLRELCERATPCAPGYEVTRDGRVFSTESNWRGYGRRELDQTPNSHGYPRVRLTIDGRRTSRLVHTLVAAAFLPPRPSVEHQVRHLDGNRTNNRVENLAWGTAKENADDRAAHGTTASGPRNGAAKLTEEIVAEIRSLASSGASQRTIAKRFGVSQRTICNAIRKETWR